MGRFLVVRCREEVQRRFRRLYYKAHAVGEFATQEEFLDYLLSLYERSLAERGLRVI